MTSTSPRALWDYGISRRIAAAALAMAALNAPFSGSTIVPGVVFAAQSGAAATAPSRTPPPPRTASSKAAPTKPPQTQESRLRSLVKSKIALVVDANTSEELLVKDADRVVPIASITKLMTAMVVLDAKPPMDEMLKISDDDRDLVMRTISRLHIGWELSREDMLHLALMASENRAAAALSRYYPGGRPAFIQAMNAKAA
jgi:D-alanyl-D-alanine carboxypeptidase